MKKLIITILSLFLLTACDEKKEIQAPVIKKVQAKNIDINKKKADFFNMLTPFYEASIKKIQSQRDQLLEIDELIKNNKKLSNKNLQLLEKYSKTYKVDGKLSPDLMIKKLLLKVAILPKSLILSQAANESAWGTSRFAKQANNYFGQWCFKKGCGLVPLQRTDGAVHEVQKFDSIQGSVDGYLLNINSNSAYKELRSIRSKQMDANPPKNALELAEGLSSYSSRGSEYVDEIQSMIKKNVQYW